MTAEITELGASQGRAGTRVRHCRREVGKGEGCKAQVGHRQQGKQPALHPDNPLGCFGEETNQKTTPTQVFGFGDKVVSVLLGAPGGLPSSHKHTGVRALTHEH